MLKLIVFVVVFFLLTDTTNGDYCSCYCLSTNIYTGTAYTSSCSSSSCQSACYTLRSCLSWSDTYGSCSGSVLDSTSYSTVLDVSTIIGIVIGSLAGVCVLIGVIVTVIILCKRKPTQVFAFQAPPLQQMTQPNFINMPGQQWPYGFQQQPYFDPMNNINPQYPGVQPVKVQA